MNPYPTPAPSALTPSYDSSADPAGGSLVVVKGGPRDQNGVAAILVLETLWLMDEDAGRGVGGGLF